MDQLKDINDFTHKVLADLLFKILPEYRTILELENNVYNLTLVVASATTLERATHTGHIVSPRP